MYRRWYPVAAKSTSEVSGTVIYGAARIGYAKWLFVGFMTHDIASGPFLFEPMVRVVSR